jgi:hypothetical protein
MTIVEWAAQFHARFAGLERAHGHWTDSGKKKVRATGSKNAGSHGTVHSPATPELWAQHLAGTYSLGIVPIRDDATCVFGAIDVDDYKADVVKIHKEIQERGLPLVPCRTKSGGIHLYCFTSEPVPATLMRAKLMEWAVALGYSGVEVFPKQAKLANDKDYGNWINMPYFGGEKTDRYASIDGVALDVDTFLKYAETQAQTEISLTAIVLPEDAKLGDLLYEAPPCLQCLAKNGIPDGQRNKVMFNLAVYCKKRFGEKFKEKMDELNVAIITPPLPSDEMTQLGDHAKKKEYNYTCKQDPLMPVCSRQICLTRQFGVATDEMDPGVNFGQLVKVLAEPPYYIWDVNGFRIQLQTSELMEQGRFHRKCFEKTGKWPNQLKQRVWHDIVQSASDLAIEEEVPPDSTPRGRMWVLLEQYCSARNQAVSKDQLLMNKVWENEGKLYFSGPDFVKYLDQQRFKVEEQLIWAWLKEGKATQQFFRIKSRGMRTWCIPAFEKQTEPHDIPRVTQPEDTAL